MNATENVDDKDSKVLASRCFCQQILDEKRVWRSRKQVVPESLGLELRHTKS